MELGLGLQGNKRPEAYGRLARVAEEGGFDVVSVFHDLFFQPAIAPLLLIAQATERVRLGPAALNPFTLHPVEIAGQIAALDAVSGGRAYLGLVRGTWLEELRVERSRPVTALREAVEVVRRLLAGDATGFEGSRFALPPGRTLQYDVVRREVPLLIGAWAPRMAALGGELAREVKIGGSANPAMVGVMRRRIANDDVGIVVGAVTVVDSDRRAARRRARAEAALYLPVVARLDPTLDAPPELVRAVEERYSAGDRQGAGDLIPDELLDAFAFSGTPDDVIRQAERLFEAGAHRVEFGTPHGLTDEAGVELLARRVAPHFR